MTRQSITPTDAPVSRARRPLPPVGAIAGLAAIVVLAMTVVLTRPAPATVAAACGATAATGLGAGECAPNFTLPDTQGRPVTLGSLRGHPVLLHFWAVGCTSCAAEYPDFARAVAAYAPRGVRVVAVDAWGEAPSLVQQWQGVHHLPAAMLIDQPQAVVRQYGVQGTPTTLFIDRDGRIVSRTTGPLTFAAFDHALTTLA